MKIPFSVQQFFEVIERYNIAVFPMQIVLLLLAVLMIYFAFTRYAESGKWISLLLSFLWLWMGTAYHLLYFTAINKAAYLFGALFILQAILIFNAGYLKQELAFRFRKDAYGLIGGLFIFYALAIYPALGYLLGHVYPASPTFGLPCPTTIFTFGLFLWTEGKFPKRILIIPFLWAVVGVSAALSLGVMEDLGIIISGITAALLLFIRDRRAAAA